MFAPDTPPMEQNGFPGPGALTDIADTPEMNLPAPGHSPMMQHSPAMAGDALPVMPAPPAHAAKKHVGKRK